MVETLTEPLPPIWGWHHCFADPSWLWCGDNPPDDWSSVLKKGEVADACSAIGDFPTAPVDLLFEAPTPPFRFTAKAAAYFSNSDGACVPKGTLACPTCPVYFDDYTAAFALLKWPSW